jgi:hypothetical protein
VELEAFGFAEPNGFKVHQLKGRDFTSKMRCAIIKAVT